MDKPSEQALHPQHEKKSGKARDSKSADDIDIGCHDYGAGGKREQLNGLWAHASKEVVGLSEDRIMTNCYSKTTEGEKKHKPDLLDEVLTNGPPMANVSHTRRVF